MAEWSTDTELFALIRTELFTAVVGDAMDRIGLQRQFLPPQLAPLDSSMVIVGRAMTVLGADVHIEVSEHSTNPVMKKPFGLMFEALDSLQEDEVYICTGASPEYALWGGLMSVRARYLRAAGAVVDGYLRDSREILDLGFPVVSRGCYAQDQGPRGKVIDYRCPIRVGAAYIEPGDIIFGDRDGVLVIPRHREAQIVEDALKKVRGESQVRAVLEQGLSTVEAFRKYGIM